MAASTLLGVALVALVAFATVVVAVVVWDHEQENAEVENAAAVQQTNEALQTSLGRLLATLRGADGLVDERGNVDPASFQAFARAVAVLPAAETLALAQPVAAGERAAFEARTGLRIIESDRAGASRPAGSRPAYLPVVTVWPATAETTPGLDLLSEPTQRRALVRAAAAREAVFTDLLTLPGGQQGLLAFKPLYAAGARAGAPIGFVSASFATRVVADILGGLPPEVRVRVQAGDDLVYESVEPPGEGAVGSLSLGGRRWVVTAQGASPSRRAPLAILVAGFVLAALLAAFTGSRMSFERRLVRANASEREARERAELLERNAAHLAAALTVRDVAESTVADLTEAGTEVAAVHALRGDVVDRLASSSASEVRPSTKPYALDAENAGAEAIRTGEIVEVVDGRSYDERYPTAAEARRRNEIESVIAVPLRNPEGSVIGALIAASRDPRWLDDDRRQLLLALAEQTGVALERAMLFETEREARRLAQLLEQNAAHLAAAVTVEDVAASTVADLERAGFASAAVLIRFATRIELLAAAGVPDDVGERRLSYPVESTFIGAEVLRTGKVVEIDTRSGLEPANPELAELRKVVGVGTLLAVPLRAADRKVIGVLEVGAHDPEFMTPNRRQVIQGVAEQCGLALERAQLHADAERTAAAAAFVAELAETLERSTTVSSRARRLVELLTAERATFAAVHLLEEGDAALIAVSGSRPPETGDDARWSEYLHEAIATGRTVLPRSSEADAIRGNETRTLILPLRARGSVIGALTIRTAADARWAPAIPPAFAREIASRAAVRIDNALLYERERDVSHSLQLGLLGGGLPEVDGVVITAAYRPGTEMLEVGGDWYDAFSLPSGTIALVVGDVVGHGLEAAVAMGQLRGAVSALAQTGSPAALLGRLDAFVENVPSAATATLAYVELDVDSGRIRYACAGHPPPLVVGAADGTAKYLWDGRSPPLGAVLGDARAEAVDRLEDGETLVLYTDGLIERRGESLDVGLERLAESAARHIRAAQTLADDISDGLLRGEVQDDDVCVLTVHLQPVASVFCHTLVASPSELARFRSRLRAWLVRHHLDIGVVHSTVLAVSEAVANAIEHGYMSDGEGIVSVDARLTESDELEITVRDEGTWRERRRGEERGRGLPIIEAIVDEVSIDRSNGATVVRMRRSTANEVPA